jgi:signal peptidase II
LKKYSADYAYLFTIAGIVIVFDQWTKWWVQNNLAFGEMWSPWDWLLPYVRLVNWQNTGMAFGMFQSGGTILAILAVLVSIGILYYFPKVPRSERLIRFALALQLGGAVGNLIDRFRQGYVTDFASLGNFAVFNVADACISIGVALLILAVWWKDMQQKKQTEQAAAEGQAVEPENLSEDHE